MAAAVGSPKREMAVTFFTVFLTSVSRPRYPAMEQSVLTPVRPPLTACAQRPYGARTIRSRAVSTRFGRSDHAVPGGQRHAAIRPPEGAIRESRKPLLFRVGELADAVDSMATGFGPRAERAFWFIQSMCQALDCAANEQTRRCS